MSKDERVSYPADGPSDGVLGMLNFAGFRFWPASLLPALVGTTLPFWLRPPGFSFRWIGAIEFLVATILFHAGFSFLLTWFHDGGQTDLSRNRSLIYSGACVLGACMLGIHINQTIPLGGGVHGSIFIIYGLSALFVGVLYVVPPLSLYRKVGGEIVIAEGLGVIPVLGAYLVQVGDITRTVYLASLPLVVVIGLWVWVDELAGRSDDEKMGRKTMVHLFSPRFSGRVVVLFLSTLFFVSLILAVYSGALNPITLIAFLLAGLAWRIVTESWQGYPSKPLMLNGRKDSIKLYLIATSIITLSSLVPLFR